MLDFTAKIRAFADKYGMLRSRIAHACVSGGADSMALLNVLTALAPDYGFTVKCLHFDHRLRGAESDRDREFVRDYCASRGIAIEIGYGDTIAAARERGTGVEETARELRYAFFSERANGGAIITAHNADDNAETVLLNLARGSGARGLAGIPPVRGGIERPLLCVTRAEIEQYLLDGGIPHVEDSTNAEHDMARNRIRGLVMPVLRGINSKFSEHTLSASELLRGDDAYIMSHAAAFVERCADENAVPVRELTALAAPVASRVVAMMAGVSLPSERIADVLALCGSTVGVKSLDLPGVLVRRERDMVKFLPPRARRRKKQDYS